MKFITTDEHSIQELASIALKNHLYQSPAWTLITCYEDILADDEIAKNSKLIIISVDGVYAGAIFHNEEDRWSYHDTNIQVYVKPEFRCNGYAKALYAEMNKALISSHYNGTLSAGYGVNGSLSFWGKMNELHSSQCNDFLPLQTTW